MAAHYKDLRELYAKRMECHGNGMALMQPISGEDCQPVCCGYFDRNGDWNLITKITTDPTVSEDGWIPLEAEPVKVKDVLIEWQPKTALGMSAVTLGASGETPDNLPGGADAQIKYTSDNKFGAVLMTMKPITLHAYNDERLFIKWLEDNKEQLYTRHGTQLKKYGMWLVTRTYNALGASINAWLNNKVDTVISLKAKANMLGELGQDLSWTDKLTDKDWSHYRAKTSHGLVVFMDGIEIKPMEWWKEGIRFGLLGRSRSSSRSVPPSQAPNPQLLYPQDPVRPPETLRLIAVGQSKERPMTLVADEEDDDVLRDAGLKQMNRSMSLRRVSYTPSLAPSNASSARSRSLRRETRSISVDRSLA